MVGRIRPAGAPATVKSARHNFASGTNEPSLANVRHSRLQARRASPRQAIADPEPLENRTIDWRIRSASRAQTRTGLCAVPFFRLVIEAESLKSKIDCK